MNEELRNEIIRRWQGGVSMRRAQWLFGGVSPAVRQSSRIVWSKFPGCTAALKAFTVFSSASGLSSSLCASSRMLAASCAGSKGKAQRDPF